jgi:hypothetical protein
MLDPIEEAKYKALRDACRELHVPTAPDVFIGMKVHEGGILTFDDTIRAHSWTRNFYSYMAGTLADFAGDGGAIFGAGKMASKTNAAQHWASATLTGSRQSSTILAYGFVDIGTGTPTFGIRVGTGNTTFTTEDINLATVIAGGVAAGQLSHAGQIAGIQSYDATPGAEKWTIIHSRVFNNNSGGTISIAEIGLFHYGAIFGNTAYNLMERSVLASAVPLVNGAQLTVNYTLRLTSRQSIKGFICSKLWKCYSRQSRTQCG